MRDELSVGGLSAARCVRRAPLPFCVCSAGAPNVYCRGHNWFGSYCITLSSTHRTARASRTHHEHRVYLAGPSVSCSLPTRTVDDSNVGEPPQLQRTARRAPSFVQPRAVTSQTPPPPPRLPEGPIIHDALTLPASSIASNDSSVASNNPADALQQQQLVNATQHPYDARLISTPQDQSLSLGNGHSGFGAPRRLILSEERSSRYERPASLDQPWPLPTMHGYVHAGPTPALPAQWQSGAAAFFGEEERGKPRWTNPVCTMGSGDLLYWSKKRRKRLRIVPSKRSSP